MKSLFESLKTHLKETARTDDGASSRSSPSTTLYSCSDCETTFISEKLQSCPKCDGTLDTTPNEYELGIGPSSPGSSSEPSRQ